VGTLEEPHTFVLLIW